MPGLAGGRYCGVPLDELVGDRAEVRTDVVRLRADVERGVALAQDEPGLPAGRGSTDGVPYMTRDQADMARIDLERGRYRVVGLRRGLVAAHGPVDAETALENVDDAAMLQLPPGNLQRVVGEREQPEAVVAEPAQGRGDLGMGRHGGEPVGELGGVGVADRDVACSGEHL